MNEPDPLAHLHKHLEFVADAGPTGSLWFVTTDDFQQQQQLSESLSAQWQTAYQTHEISLTEYAFDLWDQVRAQASQEPHLFLVRDFDRLAPEDVTQVLDYLNRGREAINRGRYHMVFFLLEPSLPSFIRSAGDFWSWRRGTSQVMQQQEPAFEAEMWQNLIKRYYLWLQKHAFEWERTRLQHLQNAMEKADFEPFPRKGLLANGQACDLVDVVGRGTRQLITAPFGYYKAKEMLEYFQHYIETGLSKSTAEERDIPVAIDLEALDLTQAIFSEKNLALIFGSFQSLFKLKKFRFSFYCSAFEQLDTTQQGHLIEQLENLNPKQIIITCNDACADEQVFEKASFDEIQVMPIPYRWLEHNVRQTWGVDLAYRKGVYELMRIPEVRAALVFWEQDQDFIPRRNIILWKTLNTGKLTFKTNSPKGISQFFTNQPPKEPIQLKDVRVVKEYQSIMQDQSTIKSIENLCYDMTFNKEENQSDIFTLHVSPKNYKYNSFSLEFSFFFMPIRFANNKFFFLHDSMILWIATRPLLENKQTDKETTYISNDTIKASSMQFLHLDPEKKKSLYNLFTTHFSTKDKYNWFLQLITFVRVLDDWENIDADQLKALVSQFRDWLLAEDREPIPVELQADWIEMLREAYEEPIFQKHFLPILQTAAKGHADPVTQTIAETVLQPPPLPDQARFEDQLYGYPG